MAVAAFSAWMTGGAVATVAGITVCIGAMVKHNITPTARAGMAIAALTGPMTIGALMAGCAIGEARVVKYNIGPIGGGMAGGTLSWVVVGSGLVAV